MELPPPETPSRGAPSSAKEEEQVPDVQATPSSVRERAAAEESSPWNSTRLGQRRRSSAFRRWGSGLNRSSSGSSLSSRRLPPAENLASLDSMQPEDFKEVWVELEQGGHNLTSVLNNPRETMVDLIYGVFGAFDADQAALEALNLAQPVLEPKQVDVSSVEPFLRKTGALSRAYVRNHRQRRGSSSTSQPVVPPNFEDGERAASMPSASSVTACFEAVPPLYFNANYSLEDPAIFEKVVENAGPEQQESLSHYLDLVEVCLLGQISERAGVFMDGLQTTHVLKDHVMEACRSVNLLRQVMRSLEDDVVLEALRVPRLSQRQKNLVALQEQLVLMQEVRRSKDSIEALICTEDFGGALDIIDSARGLLRGGLQDLQCMTRAAVSLNEFGALVGNLLADRFVTTAVSKEFSDTEKRLLLDTTSGLKRLGELPKALDLYRQRLEEDLKLIMRTVVGDYLASMGEDGVLVDTYDPLQDPEGEGGQSVNGLRALEHKAFLSCLEMCFEHLEAALKGGTAVLRMIDADLYASSDQKASLPSRLEVGDVTQPKTKECLQGLSRLIETAVSQLLTIRRDYHASLTAEQLKELWELSVAFIERVEGLTGTAGAKLRLTLLNQAKALVGHQHEANKKNLLGRLDAEKWSQVDVSEERQGHMDQLASGSILNGASLNNDNSARGQLPPSSQLQDKALVRERKREAVVDGAKYKAVWTSLVLVEMQVQMLRLAALFPAVATDVLTRSVDLLRLYNSRTTQLVLGAGAIHSAAKLRSISAKHLALCAQSLALVRALVPHMRAALAAQLSRKHQNLLAEMDGVSHDFLEHHDKILSKFVSIIQEMVDQSSVSLRDLDWDQLGEEQSSFGAAVVKGVCAMHKILQQQLPPEQLQDVFCRIVTLLNRKVPECCLSIGSTPSTLKGRRRILNEVDFISSSLSGLSGVDSSSLNKARSALCEALDLSEGDSTTI